MADEVLVRRNLSRLVIGLAIIAAGFLFTLDNLHVLHAETYLSYWPLVIVLIGAMQVVETRSWGAFVWGLVLIVVGAWLLAQNLGVVTVSIWTLSPLLLVLLGATIIWRGCCPPLRARGASLDGSAFIKGTAVFGAFERTGEAADFRGADLVAIMGACKLDLRRAAIAGGEAVIDVLAFMGGVEILVPQNWIVDTQVLPLMGGVENLTHVVAGGGAPQRLVVRGTAFMGGIDVKN